MAFKGLGDLPSGCGGSSATASKSPLPHRRNDLKPLGRLLSTFAERLTKRLARVSDEIEKLHFNVCVAQIYELTNGLSDAVNNAKQTAVTADLQWAIREAAEILVALFHPMMPHLAEECYAALGHDTLVAQQAWPDLEPDLLVEDTVTLPVQVNGRKRADVTVARDAGNQDIEAAALALPPVQRALEGKTPKRVIVVPQRIVNIVA